MTYQNIPKIGFLGPKEQCVDLALHLAAKLASQSKLLEKKNIYLEDMMDFYPVETPVWRNEILAVEFKNLDRFKITKFPDTKYALSLSKKYPEVLLSVELEDEEGTDVFNAFNGRSLSEIRNYDTLISDFIYHWDIETLDI